MEYGNNIAKVVTHVLSAGSPADYFFFFSSRRRHTMSLCDWSSDVCSSDLLHESAERVWYSDPLALLASVARAGEDRKSTRLNSSHTVISYAVFCLKKKK